MKADWVREQNGARELARPQPLQGITKDLQVEEIMALPILDTPLKRTDIVWPVLSCLKISIPPGNLSCCGCQEAEKKDLVMHG